MKMDVRTITVYIILLVGHIEAADKCNLPVDIAAVIDVSDNLSPRNLPEIKNFLKTVANIYILSMHASHMSVILAGRQVSVAIESDDAGANRNKFAKAVEKSVKHLGGAWSLDEGLGLAKKVFNGSRNFVPRVLLVITNGQQRNGNSDALEKRARELHAMGVHVYVVSVGDGVSRDELGVMVKNEIEYLYHVDGFEDLDALAVNISNDICRKNYIGSLAVCKTKVDVGFIVDSSGSIRNEDYVGMKNFVKALSVYMGFSPENGGHMGVVLYSKDARVWTKFGGQANFRKLFRILGKMLHLKDLTRIDLGLDVANSQLFTREAGMREDAKKVAILFTDGEQTTKDVNDLIPLSVAAGRLRDRGIVIFAVGIGSKVRKQQLVEIADSEEHVIMLRSFSELRESAVKIASSTCQQVIEPPVINFTQSVYNANEGRKALIGISVTQSKVIAPLTVSIHPSPATADNDDFFASVQNVTFQPGETQKQIEIEIVDDQKVEPTESFVLSLASSSRTKLGEPSSVNIIDNDVVINFTRPVFNVKEDDGNAKVEISVTEGAVVKPVTVRITPKSDTADEDDFDTTAKDVTFQPGETGPKFVNIDLIDDPDDEPVETFTVSLSSNSPAILGGPSSINIEDNDVPPPPVVKFTRRVYSASESGNGVVAVSVTMGQVTEPVTVRVTPRGDTADEDDFDTTAKDVTFQPGETGPKFVNIDLTDDPDDEPTENFTVSLSSNSRVILGGPSTVNIRDNDLPPPPVVKFTRRVYNASESGNAVVAVYVTMGQVTEPVTVRITPREDTADEDDFDATAKDVTFQPGETGPKFVNIDLTDDPDDEPTENFTVSLSSNSRVILGGPSTVNIRDNDLPPPPVVKFTRRVYNASESDNAVVAVYVTMGQVTEPVTVRITPRGDTADEYDFDATAKDVTFQSGETGPKFANIDLIDDPGDEPTENFTVSLSSNSRVILGGPSTVNILDNDVAPMCGTPRDDCNEHAICTDVRPGVFECSCNPGYAGDGKNCKEIRIGFTKSVYDADEEAATAEVQLIVTSGGITTPVTVMVEPVRDSASLADFNNEPVKVTFQPGEVGPKSIIFKIVDDDEVEEDESFKVTLSSGDPVGLEKPAFVKIVDNDVPPPPAISFTRRIYNGKEGDSVIIEVSVTDGKVTEPVTVKVTTNSDTAGKDDFGSVVKNVTFEPGEKGPKLVRIPLVDDADDEPTEKFAVSLSSDARVILGEPASINIQDNDEPICKTDKHDCHRFAICNDIGLGLYECACRKGYSGDGKSCQVISFSFTSAVYDVKENEKALVEIQLRTGKIDEPVAIEVQTNMGTADGKDFIPVSKIVTFQVGEAKNKIVEIDLIDDNVIEPTEDFTVRLSSPMRVALGPPATVRIEDNDAQLCDVDIGFLLDSTASMRDCNFQKEKDFVKKIAGYFQIAPEATRISTIVYGADALLAKRFNETKSLKDFQTEIDNLPLKGGRANLDEAMHLAASAMFTVKNGMRQNVPKVLIVFNDGVQKVITQSAKDISSMLRKNEVRVIVIGVGEAEHDLLAQIVASPEDLIMTEKFQDATENLVSLLKLICAKRDNGSCRILKKEIADLKIGGCMSEKPVEIGVCGGHCSSFSNFIKKNGFYEMNCGCCRPKRKSTITVDLKCSMNTYQAFNIRSAESCSCESCESVDIKK